MAGNRAAKGNPQARRMAELRRAALVAATPERVAAIVEKMAALAVEGDTTAARLFLEYSLGKAPQAIALTDADGGPLGLDLGKLLATIREGLREFPEAQIALAAKFKRLADDARDDV